jgi:tetratricopeptide (TPR) repeat protein
LGESISRKKGIGNNYPFIFFGWKINALIFSHQYEVAEGLIKTYLDTVSVLDKSADTTTKKERIDNLGTIYGLLAIIKKETGNYNDAFAFFEKAFSYHKRINKKNLCASHLNNTGLLYSEKIHDYNKALSYFRKAIKYADNNDSIQIFNNLGTVYNKLGFFDSSFYFFPICI